MKENKSCEAFFRKNNSPDVENMNIKIIKNNNENNERKQNNNIATKKIFLIPQK